jgi:hypothetical protein
MRLFLILSSKSCVGGMIEAKTAGCVQVARQWRQEEDDQILQELEDADAERPPQQNGDRRKRDQREYCT